jgi:hypothetical protein
LAKALQVPSGIVELPDLTDIDSLVLAGTEAFQEILVVPGVEPRENTLDVYVPDAAYPPVIFL